MSVPLSAPDHSTHRVHEEETLARVGSLIRSSAALQSSFYDDDDDDAVDDDVYDHQ